MLIAIVDQIDINAAYEHLQSPEAGGVNLFVGTVRNHAKGKDVERLVFEAYEPMALAEMQRIAVQAKERWQLTKLVMLHVVGERKIGDAVVIVGAAAAHRQESFEACRFLIDELKARVPIWKKEYYKDSSVWVNAHP
jgi:molybdopterin synthase catalytic subunit